MDTQLIVFIAIIALAIIISVFQTRKKNQQKSAMMRQLLTNEGFNPSQEWMGKDGKSGIAIDEKEQTIGLIRSTDGDVVTGSFSYEEILSSEILEDNEVIIKTSRKSRAGRTKINQLGLGGFDSEIDRKSWDMLSHEIIRKVSLRVTVDSPSHPLHEISFMSVEGKKQTVTYSNAVKNAKRWHALLEVLIRKADEHDSKSPQTG